MKNLRSIPLCALAGALLCTVAAAQSAAPKVRIVSPIDNNELVTLKGNVNPHANAANDRGPVSASMALPDLTLVLSRSQAEQAAFDAFVASQYDKSSPNYHRWLTAAQIGAQYGPAQADIASITGWLASQGFAVKSVAPDGMTIKFAGTAGTVQSAFHTSIHNLSVHGVAHYANMTNPQVPAALAPVVVGVKALHNFLPRPMHKMGSLVQFNGDKGKWQRIAKPGSGLAGTTSSLTTSTAPSLSALAALPKASFKAIPQYGINGGSAQAQDQYLEEDVTPWDFAAIYNVTPAWNAGYTGTGQTIAIAGTSEICLGQSSSPCNGENDISTYRSEFDLPAGLTPTQTDTGMGPAATVCTGDTDYCDSGDQVENTLDVELSGAVATGAQIKLYVTGQIETGTNAGSIDTTYDSASYIIENQSTVKANILSLSYGECELFQGTAENVAYYDLWQTAAAEGISVFVATGDSGSPSCDDGYGYGYDGNPYVAQYGLSVNGMASTPYNTAVGGTDFSWCQPYYNSDGDLEGCATSSTSQGSPTYWGTSNNSSNGSSALGYVPEIPWNDTCENPIQARYIETLLSAGGSQSADAALGINPTTPEETCNILYNQNDWYELDEGFGFGIPGLETLVDTVGGSGGVSGCIVSSTTDTALGSCASGSTSTGITSNPDTGTSQASINLTNDGWQVPSWQTGVTGISSLGLATRALPDVSFFSGDGTLDSATLICVQSQGSCALSSTTENTAQEVGGTSVATPEMAGVMALIDQRAGAAQGLANPELYDLAARQTYSECSAESVTSSSSCYFQDIDNGPTAASGSPAYTTAQTIAMPCALSSGTPEGGDEGSYSTTLTASPNCYAMSSGDSIGTLGLSSTTAAYNSTTGFDLATGLGSLNVANVLFAWQGVETYPNGYEGYGININPLSTTTTSTSATGTLTVFSANGYSGTVALTCTPVSGQTGTACTLGSNSVTLGTSTTSQSVSIAVTVPAATSKLVHPASPVRDRQWLGAGGSAVLALLVFFGIPARRRSWRTMLGVVVLLAFLGSMSACGGGSTSGSSGSGSGGSGGSSGATAVTYTFTVTATGTPSISGSQSQQFTVTVD